MAVCEIQFTANNSILKMTSATVITPEKKQGPFPVLYLLHGLSDNHTAWTRRTSIERYVQDLPLIVVMPNGERGWYTDAAHMPFANFESLIIDDIVGFVDSTFQTIPSREGRAIAGISMGGYGAFKLALKHQDMFCAAASLSGVMLIQERINPSPERAVEMELIYGDNPLGGPDDIIKLVDESDKDKIPALWMNCGTDDFLVEHNRWMDNHLNELGISHTYSEAPGAHSWDYWDGVIQDAIGFVKEQFKI